MERAIAGDEDSFAQCWVGRTISLADRATCFFDQHDSPGNVPRRNLEGKEAIEPAGSEISQVDG